MYVAFNLYSRRLSPDHSFLEKANIAPKSNDLHNIMLQLGQRTFAHNTAGVPSSSHVPRNIQLTASFAAMACLEWVVW